MNYFFGSLNENKTLFFLRRDEWHHCVNVLRLKEGDEVGVLTHQGEKGIARLLKVHKNECVAEIVQIESVLLPDPKIHIVVSPPKNSERLEWMVEKLSELQVSSILFVKSDRCVRKQINIKRLEQIVFSSCKQSINPHPPVLYEPKNLSNLIQEVVQNKNSLFLLLHCYSSESKKKLNTEFLQNIQKNKYARIYSFIGPEGDWTEYERVEILNQLNPCIEIDLGTSRLRTETAAIHIAAVLRILWGV